MTPDEMVALVEWDLFRHHEPDCSCVINLACQRAMAAAACRVVVRECAMKIETHAPLPHGTRYELGQLIRALAPEEPR